MAPAGRDGGGAMVAPKRVELPLRPVRPVTREDEPSWPLGDGEPPRPLMPQESAAPMPAPAPLAASPLAASPLADSIDDWDDSDDGATTVQAAPAMLEELLADGISGAAVDDEETRVEHVERLEVFASVERPGPQVGAAAPIDRSWARSETPTVREQLSLKAAAPAAANAAVPEPLPPAPTGPRKATPPPTPPPRPEPPPTRIVADIREGSEPFERLEVAPIPEVPEPGFGNAVAYAIRFTRARWQRRAAIATLEKDITTDTAALDQVLGALGKEGRRVRTDNRALVGEHHAIDEAERRCERIDQTCAELTSRQAEENTRFDELEAERLAKVTEAEESLEKAEAELVSLEGQRRSLRDKKKAIDRRHKALLKSADDREDQAGKAAMPDAREQLRRAAEDLRADAAAIDPQRLEIDRRLLALDAPMTRVAATVDTLKAELESARRSLHDAREGHRHRLAELEAEMGRRTRELAQAQAEIARRLVTLGTLMNLHRVDAPELVQLYARIDRLRTAIGTRTREIDRLTAEREAYDRGSLVRGYAVMGGLAIVLSTIIVIILALT